MTSHILSLSGGLDSTTLCASLLAEHGPSSVLPVFFDYGSKHGPWELRAARDVVAHYSLVLIEVDLRAVFAHAKSALLAADIRNIPKAAYNSDSMSDTVVPGRNLMFASVLASMAESRGIPHIALATHAGDHHLYPDCRPSFNMALDAVVTESTGGAVHVVTPFAHMTKAKIVSTGTALHVPFSLTRSCYEQTEASCGGCGTCLERIEAFAANGLCDPVKYVSG